MMFVGADSGPVTYINDLFNTNTIATGDWVVDGGSASISGGAMSFPGTSWVHNITALPNDCRVTVGYSGNTGTIRPIQVALYESGSGGYLATARGGDGLTRIDSMTSWLGGESTITSGTGAPTAGSISIERQGSAVRLYINGSLILSASSGTYSTNRVGIRGFNGVAALEVVAISV